MELQAEAYVRIWPKPLQCPYQLREDQTHHLTELQDRINWATVCEDMNFEKLNEVSYKLTFPLSPQHCSTLSSFNDTYLSLSVLVYLLCSGFELRASVRPGKVVLSHLPLQYGLF
jgi:hypothetical protein